MEIMINVFTHNFYFIYLMIIIISGETRNYGKITEYTKAKILRTYPKTYKFGMIYFL